MRKYEDKEISNRILVKFQSRRWAPSWGNTQCWGYYCGKGPNTGKLQGTKGPQKTGHKVQLGCGPERGAFGGKAGGKGDKKGRVPPNRERGPLTGSWPQKICLRQPLGALGETRGLPRRGKPLVGPPGVRGNPRDYGMPAKKREGV